MINKPEKHSHYHKDVSDRKTLDIYGLCEVFEVDDKSGRLHHAIKKILMAGKRGSKGYRQDIQEAVDTLNEKLKALDLAEMGSVNDGADNSYSTENVPQETITLMMGDPDHRILIARKFRNSESILVNGHEYKISTLVPSQGTYTLTRVVRFKPPCEKCGLIHTDPEFTCRPLAST